MSLINNNGSSSSGATNNAPPQQQKHQQQQPYLTPYLQKVSNRNPNAQQQQQQQQPGAPPLNPASAQNTQSATQSGNTSSSSMFYSQPSIWKNNDLGDNQVPQSSSERPKRAIFSSSSSQQQQGGHRRSLSGGAQSRLPFQSRMHYSSTGAAPRIQTPSSTSSEHHFGGGAAAATGHINYNSAPPSGSTSFSAYSESTGAEEIEDRMDSLSLGAFSSSPCSSTTNSVISSLSHSSSQSSGSLYGAAMSRNSNNIITSSYTDLDQNSLMRIPDHVTSDSPPSWYHHLIADSPPRHGGGPLSLNAYADSAHGTGGSSSYGRFSSSPSSYSQFSGSSNLTWGPSSGAGADAWYSGDQQPQPLGANLQIYHRPPSPASRNAYQSGNMQQQHQPPHQMRNGTAGSFQQQQHGNAPQQYHQPPAHHQQHPAQQQQPPFSQYDSFNASPQGNYYPNPVPPRYSTTPSSPTGPRRMRRKAHSTPSSPSGTPNPSPPKGYNRKPRSLGPSPQKPRPGGSRQYSGWAGGVTVSGGSRMSPSKSSREKSRPRKKEESQGAKQKYKELSRQMKDSGSYKDAKAIAEKEMRSLPNEVHWRVCMDLADMSKRENLLSDARYWFTEVNKKQPRAAQGWLEFAKLEEECGNVDQCHKLLMKGLQHCQHHESLLIKAVKFYENINKIHCARELLGRLRYMTIEKNWKIFMEGALLESRDGNVKLARDVFKLLMHKVRRHGPIYYEAYKLEEKCEEYGRAIKVVEKGLEENPRYGPLWFSYLHLLEREASQKAAEENKPIDLTRVREAVKNAVKTISQELIWKVYFEAAHIEERANEIKRARTMYARSVVNCLVNLRWKVWLAGARTELNAGKNQVARDLLNRALKEVPNKTRAQVLIECARLEEYYGNIEKARDFLNRAKQEAKHEWKVFLESILLEMRANNTRKAIEEAEEALEIHRGTGRLWAVLIQLKQCDGPDEQIRIFRQALIEVPKSGEVWCEGARIRLNPLSPKFNLDKARDYLNFAIKFTPQYGDSFIEYLRLELLSKGPRLEEQDKLYLEQLCVNADPNYGPLWFFCKTCPTDSTRSVLRRAKNLLRQELTKYQVPYQRAILRFACKSVSVKIDTDTEEYKQKDFTMSLQTLTTADDEETRKKRIFGSEHSA